MAVSGTVVLVVGWWLWPVRWQISAQPQGTTCVIREGMSTIEVAQVCGEPAAQGGQPKLVEGLSTICSAPCEAYAEHVVFHDCEGKVFRVVRRSGASGCVFQNGGQPAGTVNTEHRPSNQRMQPAAVFIVASLSTEAPRLMRGR